MESGIHKKHIYSLILLVALIFTTIISGIFLGIKLKKLYVDTYEGPQNILLIEQTINTIVYVDEVLTMSSRMAAFTADSKWEDRYNKIVDTLNESINRAIEISPEAEKAFTEVDEANQALIQMEIDAFNLTKNAKAKEAQDLLLGEKYTRQKKIYSDGVKKALMALRTQKKSLSESLDTTTVSLTGIIIVLAILLIIESIMLYLLLKTIQQRMLTQHEKLKVTSQSKSIFLANMSHEIRTPLNGILGFTKLLEQSTLDTKQKQYVDIINNSSKILLGIISDILDLSKIEHQKLELTLEPHSIHKICTDVYTLYKANAQEKDLDFILLADLQETVVQADELRLKQVISNLLSNAIKFTPEKGKVTLKVVSQDVSTTEVSFTFSIIDTGIGMDEATSAKVFEPFTQASNTTVQTHGGTGLGITISSKLVALMGSKLAVESKKEHGSTFSFEVRFKKCDTVLNEASIEEDLSKSLRILVVEDNQTNQLLIKIILEELNQKCVIANNGEEGVQEYKKGNFDIILMDLNMPVLNGLEATKQIRALEKNENTPKTPIIALTANAFESDKNNALEVGMDGFLTKPLDQQKLIQVLNSL